jgi:hypothetical protein
MCSRLPTGAAGKVTPHQRLVGDDDRGPARPIAVAGLEQAALQEALAGDAKELGRRDPVLEQRQAARVVVRLAFVADVEVPAPAVVGEERDRGRLLHARHLPHGGEGGLDEAAHGGLVGVLVSRDRGLEREDAPGIEARLLPQQSREAPQHQPGPHQEHQ